MTTAPLTGSGDRVHVAILRRPFAEKVLSGEKTVETRLMRVRRVPWTGCAVGDTVFIKVSGGPVVARASVGGVTRYHIPWDASLAELEERYRASGCIPPGYWDGKTGVKYAVMIELGGVTALNTGPVFEVKPGDRSAWRVYDASSIMSK